MHAYKKTLTCERFFYETLFFTLKTFYFASN